MMTPEILSKVAIYSIVCSLLLGCKSDEKEFSNLLEKGLQDKKECYVPGLLDGPFLPQFVDVGNDWRPENAVLAGLLDQGLIQTSRKRLGSRGEPEDIQIDLTDEGRRQAVWSGGVCFGVRQLAQIVRYTYGDNGQNKNLAIVEYSYKIGGHPDWFDTKYYQKVPGIAVPKDSKATFQKSSDGWNLRDF